MATFRGILRDVRALGASAPLRAGYEASKRSNFHRVLFKNLPDTGHRSRPVPFGDVLPLSQAARARCLADARAILDEGVRVFGGRAPTGVSASWATDPLTLSCWPEDTPWWQIDIRSDARLSDVKYVWEAARHRDLVVLARAAALEPDGPWFRTLEQMLIRWCHECRPERGVNWYSSLELALRAIAWNQVLALVGDRLSDGLRAGLDHQLVASARHLLVELPYTMTSMKNNHLLGDGLGLVVLGHIFPTHPRSTRWRSIGDRLMLKQLARHMRSDGSMIEDSLSYHRFVLEMLVVRHLLGDAPAEISAAMRSAADHLVRIGATRGPVPQFGDWDEGRVLADSAPAGDVAGAAHLALHLAGRSAPDEAFDRYDEVAWYALPAGSGGGTAPREVDEPWVSGQLSGSTVGPWSVWVKRALTVSHQHADLTSVWIARDGAWVTEDPGTGTYNGPLEVRNGFRTSSAHPVWTPAGSDLLGPHRAFRWERPDVPRGAATGSGAGLHVHVVWHEAFGQRVLRIVIVETSGVTVVDHLPAGMGEWRMTIPTGGARNALTLPGAHPVTGQDQPFAGWFSSTYGTWEPREWQTVASSDGGWLVWGAGAVRRIESVEQATVALVGLTVSADGDSVTVLNGDARVTCEAARA